MRIYTRNITPNFTVILPGPCQANCSFCYWKRDNDESSFLKSLKRALKKLPGNFTQISISGGEPTLSPVFKEALALINKYKKKGKFTKVVLTTNGIHLNKFDLTGIDHVNISRHHYDQEINEKIFGTKQIPKKKDLYSINDKVNQQGIDVNYNVVLTEKNQDLDLVEFVRFVKMTGASSLTFRNQYGVYDISKVEKLLQENRYKPYSVSTCPVCRTNTYYLEGVKLKFHSSDYEPTESDFFDENEVYEVVFHPTGDLTRDWEAKKIILKRKRS